MSITLNGTTGISTPDITSTTAPSLVGTNFTSLPSASLTGALPAIDGSALTGVAGLQTLISTTVVSVSATEVDISWSNTGYSQIRFEFENLRPVFNDVTIQFRLSNDAGATFFGTGSEYESVAWQGISTGTQTFLGASNDRILVSGNTLYYQGNQQHEGLYGSLSLYNAVTPSGGAGTGAAKAGSFDVTYSETNEQTISSSGGWKLVNKSLGVDINAIRIYYSSGNVYLNSTIRVIGIT